MSILAVYHIMQHYLIHPTLGGARSYHSSCHRLSWGISAVVHLSLWSIFFGKLVSIINACGINSILPADISNDLHRFLIPHNVKLLNDTYNMMLRCWILIGCIEWYVCYIMLHIVPTNTFIGQDWRGLTSFWAKLAKYRCNNYRTRK